MMQQGRNITGVSAVNAGGKVVIFVEADTPQFEAFRIIDTDIHLRAGIEGEHHVRSYGPATLEALKLSGVVVVQRLSIDGRDMGNYLVEAAHGL